MADNILIVSDRMGDYHRSRVKTLRSLCGDNNTIFTADLLRDDRLYKWQNTKDSRHFLLTRRSIPIISSLYTCYYFNKVLSDRDITKVVLSGYGNLSYILMSLVLKIRKVDCYIFAESWYERGKLIDALKGLLITYFYKGIFVSGTRAKRHFILNLNQKTSRVFCGYSVVDNTHYKEPGPIRILDEIHEKKTLICIARLSEEKNLDFLIECFAMSNMVSDWHLVIIGDGPLKQYLTDKWSEPYVKFVGWKTYDEIPAYIHNAALCVLPSLFEPWGLVVNEYLAAGKLCLVSEECGCVPDLIGEKDLIFSPSDKKSLIMRLNFLNEITKDEMNDLLKRFSEKMKNYTLEKWSETLIRMLEIDVTNDSRRP